MNLFGEINLEYDSLVQRASNAYLDEQYLRAHKLYCDALEMTIKSNKPPMTKCILKYMICCCVLKANISQEYAKSVNMIESLDKPLKDRFPNLYCSLAQLHHKLFRYDKVQEVIKQIDTLMEKNPALEVFYLPGTNVEIENKTKSVNFEKIKKDCLDWQKPDAVCCLSDCKNITEPYQTPKKQIFFRDPTFHGMVRVTCNNLKRLCVLNYHQGCWKILKDHLFPNNKMTDKDVLGKDCFTSDCKNNDIPSAISTIEIIGPNGQLKSLIKSSSSSRSSHKNESKGAIKKNSLKKDKEQSTIKSDNSGLLPKANSSTILKTATVVEKQNSNDCNGNLELPNVLSTVIPTSASFMEKSHSYDYQHSQIIVCKQNVQDIAFPNCEMEEIRNEKKFIYSFFCQYLKENVVQICDLYAKFKILKEDLVYLKDLDVLEFLLETKTFEVLEKQDPSLFMTNSQKKTQADLLNWISDSKARSYSSSQVSFDELYDLIDDSDEDDIYHEVEDNSSNKTLTNMDAIDNSIHNVKQSRASNLNFGSVRAGGDAPPCKKNVHESIQIFQPFESSNDHEKRGTENRKLKEYISQLENDLEKVSQEANYWKLDSSHKDHELQNIKDDQKNLIHSMEEIKGRLVNLTDKYEKMKNENVQMKTELITSQEKINSFTKKLAEINNPDFKRQELLKTFNEELKILEECIRSEEKKKLEILENSVQLEVESKSQLINKVFDLHYTKNFNSLKVSLEQCKLRKNLSEKISEWFFKTLNLNYIQNHSQCLTLLDDIQQVNKEYQSAYKDLKEELETSETIDWKSFEDNLREIPRWPKEDINDIVIDALNVCKNHCQMIQTKPFIAPTIPYQMQLQTYPQYPPQYQYMPTNMIAMTPPGLPPLIRASNISVNYRNKNEHSNVIQSNTQSDAVIQKSNFKDREEITNNSMLQAVPDNCNSKLIVPNIIEKSNFEINTSKTDCQEVNHKKSDDVRENIHLIDSSREAVVKPKKKVGVEALIQFMHQKYPGSLDNDIIEVIYEIRKNHNNSLSGVPVSQVLEEAQEYYLNSQRIHMFRYFLNDETKSTCC